MIKCQYQFSLASHIQIVYLDKKGHANVTHKVWWFCHAIRHCEVDPGKQCFKVSILLEYVSTLLNLVSDRYISRHDADGQSYFCEIVVQIFKNMLRTLQLGHVIMMQLIESIKKRQKSFQRKQQTPPSLFTFQGKCNESPEVKTLKNCNLNHYYLKLRVCMLKNIRISMSHFSVSSRL